MENSSRTTFIRWSPSAKILVTWEVLAKNLEENNVRLWDAESGKMLHSFQHRKSEGWCPQWTTDEKVCCVRAPNGEIVFYQDNQFSAGPLQSRLSLKGKAVQGSFLNFALLSSFVFDEFFFEFFLAPLSLHLPVGNMAMQYSSIPIQIKLG